MEHADLSNQLKALQRELLQIAEHNRQYFARKHHTLTERAQYRGMRERVYKIRAELYSLRERTAA
jgi:transcription elongation GreA/GreB family factor